MPQQQRRNPDADDPFTDDDWGPSEGPSNTMETVPESSVDPDRSTPFLKPANLKDRVGYLELVKISGATKYSDVTLHVLYGKLPYRIGLRTFDPSFEQLRKKFGPDKANWHGQLRYKVMPHNGRPDGFVAVRAA